MSEIRITELLSDSERHVAEKEEAHVVVLEKTFGEPADDLWRALTDPGHLAHWFGRVEGDLRSGGRYRLTDSGMEGEVRTCESPRHLSLTWDDRGEAASELTLVLTEGQDGTTLTLRHTVAENEHWRTFGPAAVGVGWDGALAALALSLRGDERADPSRMARIHETEDGRAFIDESAEAWGRAHVAAGADEGEARAAARRTASFYRGEEQPG